MSIPRSNLERIYTIWGIILILWSIYRAFFNLSEAADEFIVKPLIFLTPVFISVLGFEKETLVSIGLTAGKFVRDIYLGVGFGALFAIEGLVTNMVKHGTISLAPAIAVDLPTLSAYLLLSFATAISEEILIRGFFYTRLKAEYKSEFKALVISTLMYLFILVPVVFTRLHLTGVTLAIFIMTNLILSFANTMIFNETKTITVPVLIHVFWNLAVFLYL